ncbi:MAG: MFS transporter [Calditrichaeota bacterium]|nr:MAG: MFS transporter [Calditrichota bacterium]MBL1205255.1 MFS transporter [Calditrichota bacterium]NOG45084.1 MFS transporter [Calditrichota bacterium]
MSIKNQLSIFPILLVNFIGTLGYSIILPFLIVLVIKLGGNELIYGIMGATYSFFQLIGAPILGRWSDKFGRKKILLLSQVGTFLAWILFIIALLIPNTTLIHIDSSFVGVFILTIPLLLLFAARALDGITGGNVSVANAYLADVTSDNDRKSNFGKMAASANLGFIIGPALAGVLGGTILGELLPVIMAMMISLIAVFVIAFKMPESNPCVLSKQLDEKRINKVFGQEQKECYKLEGAEKATLKNILKLKDIPLILILYFLIFLAFNFFYVAFPIHAIQSLDWSLLKLGIFFSLIGLILVLVEGPLLNKISGKFSDGILIIFGSILLGLSFFLFLNKNEVYIFIAVLFFSLGNGLMWPSFLSILSKVAGEKYQGAVQGYASSTGSLASIIGLITGGIIYGLIGISTFWIPGILMLVIFVLAFRLLLIDKKTHNN